MDPNDVDISPTDQQAVSTSLGGLSAQLAANGKPQDAAAAAALAIQSGTKGTKVTVTTGAAARTSRAAAYGPAPSVELGIEITLNNFPGIPATRQFTGVLNWQTGASEMIVAYSPPSSGSFGGTASGMLYVPPAGVWSATAGTEASLAGPNTGPCPNAASLPAAVTSCALADFTGNFDIAASLPDGAIPGNTATLSQTASLPVMSMNGVKLAVDCNQTSLCGAVVGQSCVTPFPSSLSRTSGSFDSFSPAMVVDAAGNPYVAWTEVGSSGVQTYVRHWNGTGWDASYPPISHASAVGMAMVLLNGTPVVPMVAASDTDPSNNQERVVIHRFVLPWIRTACPPPPRAWIFRRTARMTRRRPSRRSPPPRGTRSPR